jgi:ribosomal protein S10
MKTIDVIITIKSYSKDSVFLYYIFLKHLSTSYNFQISSIFTKNKKKFTLLKSPHVNKKAKDQFECSIYKLSVHMNLPLLIVKYVLINKPKNLHFNIVKKG